MTVDLCVIGAGSGGLSVAAGAVQMGASVALFERGAMGGDCLNFGCVPSKALLAAGANATAGGRALPFGATFGAPAIDFGRVHDHIHEIIADIAPHDSVERFEGLGVLVFQEEARFTGPNEVAGSAGACVAARRFVIATGSSPAIPPIDGIADCGYLTNETIFELTERPEHLIVLGGGPVGMEIAQAFRRLGSQVTVLEMGRVLAKDDPDLVAVVANRLEKEGVEIVEGALVEKTERTPTGIAVIISGTGGQERIDGSHLMVAAGRRPNLDGLDLECAGVRAGPAGIDVDAKLKTSNRRIYAIGDVAGRQQFTHTAGYHAGIAIRNILFRMGTKVDDRAMPWVTYTDPELAQVGLSETAARAAGMTDGHQIRVLTAPFAENDRARAERTTDGLIKVITGPRGRILGAGIAGPHAGELLLPWTLAIANKLKIGAMASVVAPYPTLSEISKRVAGSYYTDRLFSTRTRRIVRLLQRLG
ncbi:MAG: FAD-dependent oxidoreductase [Alphaproteobacteria bacterium]|nr:FAD-dependent oxidoreductase [Alphaproteobacteria bacterium]